MNRTNNLIFRVLHIIVWIIFIGLSIEACGLLVNFLFSIFKPEYVSRLYQKLDLSSVYRRSSFAFYRVYSFILILSFLKVIMFYFVVMLLHRMNLAKPFQPFVVKQIFRFSYFTLIIGLMSYLAREDARQLINSGYNLEGVNQFWSDPQAFIFTGAVIYIIAIIFKTGAQLQTENELTI